MKLLNDLSAGFKMTLPEVGDKIQVWWRTDDNNRATILAVLPYTGKFPKFFNCVLRLTAPNTEKGYLEMAYKS